MSCPHARGGGTPLTDLSYDPIEGRILTIARHYFRTFAQPESQSWIGAIGTAVGAFDGREAPGVAIATLAAVQTMRQTRRSTFLFNDPNCKSCAAQVTDNERTLLSSLREMRMGQIERAAGHAMILCQGNDNVAFLQTLQTLAHHLPPRTHTAPCP